MKFLTLFFSLVLTNVAFASYFQTICSSPDASVIYAQGQIRNELLVTFVEEENVLVKKPLKDYLITQISSTDLENTRTTTCREGQPGGGGISWRNLVYRKIIITNQDGSELPENILGISEDKKSLKVDYLCETNGSSRTVCP